MASIIIVGDGPGGLSAALFLAKTQHDVRVYGKDETSMHYAYLKNYIGAEEMAGVEYQELARKQATDFGATIVDERVEAVRVTDAGVEVDTAEGTQAAEYLILSEGKKAPLAESLGLEMTPDGIEVDRNSKSKLDRVYVVGRSTRPNRSQAIISAGDGAAAALDILATVEGKDIQDWDS